MPPQAYFQESALAFIDIFYWYQTSPGFSTVVDLLLVSMVFGSLMAEGARRARFKGKFGGVLGIIMGFAVTYAIHAAGYKLVDHWATALLTMIAAGGGAYALTRGMRTGWRVFYALFTAFIIQSLFTMVFFPRWISATFGIIVIVGLVLALFAGIASLFGRGPAAAGAGAPGAPGTPTGGPDLTPIVNALNALQQDMEARFQTVNTGIGNVITRIGNIEIAVRDILNQIGPMQAFFQQAYTHFAGVLSALGIINARVAAQGQILQQHVTEMSAWRGEWTTFRGRVETGLLGLENAIRQQILPQLGTITTDIRDVKNGQAALTSDITRLGTQLTAAESRITTELGTVSKEIDDKHKKLLGELGEINDKLKGIKDIQKRVDDTYAIVEKMSKTDLANLAQQLTDHEASVKRKLSELEASMDKLSKQAKKDPKAAAKLEKLLADMQKAAGDLTSNSTAINTTLQNLQQFMPQFQELLQNMKELQPKINALGPDISTLKIGIADLIAAIDRAAQDAQRQAAGEEANLGNVERAINEQYEVMKALMPQVRALMGNLTLTINFNPKENEAKWRQQAKDALDKAKVGVGEIKLEETKITAVQTALHKARTDLATIRAVGPLPADEMQQATELDRRLEGFERYETNLLNFFRNMDVTLQNQVVDAVNEIIAARASATPAAKAKPITGQQVLVKLDAFVKELAQAIDVTLTISRQVRQIRKTRAKQKRKRGKGKGKRGTPPKPQRKPVSAPTPPPRTKKPATPRRAKPKRLKGGEAK